MIVNSEVIYKQTVYKKYQFLVIHTVFNIFIYNLTVDKKYQINNYTNKLTKLLKQNNFAKIISRLYIFIQDNELDKQGIFIFKYQKFKINNKKYVKCFLKYNYNTLNDKK